MWNEFIAFGLYLKFSTPSDKPLNFIAERFNWFPYQITNKMIIIFLIYWALCILVLEMFLKKMKTFLNFKIKDR